MGNCCNKKKYLVDRITSENNSKGSNTNTNKTSDKKKDKKEKKQNSTESEKKLILKENRKYNPDSYDILIPKKKKDMNQKKENTELTGKNKKIYDEYKDILLSYIKFREKIELECIEEKIYILQKIDNEELISLYNQIINQNNDKGSINEFLLEKKLYQFISYKRELKKNFKVMDFKMCEERIKFGNPNDNKIDLLSENLCKKLNLKNMKNNEITYINYENWSILIFHFPLKYLKKWSN